MSDPIGASHQKYIFSNAEDAGRDRQSLNNLNMSPGQQHYADWLKNKDLEAEKLKKFQESLNKKI
jgi:hypothetical protein